MPVTVLKKSLKPPFPALYAISRLQEDLEIADRCRSGMIEGHVSSPVQVAGERLFLGPMEGYHEIASQA